MASNRTRFVPVRCSDAELERWKAAAQAAGVSLSAWVRAALDDAAAKLWRDIVAAYPANHFTAGDLVLLREFCFTSETLLPVANSAAERGGMHENSQRTMHVKTAAMLAAKLRLNVSARTRTDAAKTRDAARPGPSREFDSLRRD